MSNQVQVIIGKILYSNYITKLCSIYIYIFTCKILTLKPNGARVLEENACHYLEERKL